MCNFMLLTIWIVLFIVLIFTIIFIINNRNIFLKKLNNKTIDVILTSKEKGYIVVLGDSDYFNIIDNISYLTNGDKKEIRDEINLIIKNMYDKYKVEIFTKDGVNFITDKSVITAEYASKIITDEIDKLIKKLK